MNIREAVEEHERLVLRTAYRFLGSWEDARDAAQEVFLKLHRASDTFDDRREMAPWLYRITVNTCRDFYRRTRPWVELPEMPNGDLHPEMALALEEQRRMLHAALLQLPERERVAITLREIEGLSTEEVAGRMGSTVGTVRSQISTGRARLKKILAASIAAAISIMLWLLRPRPVDLPPLPKVAMKLPAAPLQIAKTPTPRLRKAAPKQEAFTMKLVSEDESIVIYWIFDKGEEE